MKHSDFLKYLNGTLALALSEEIAWITIDLKSRKKPITSSKIVISLLSERWEEKLKEPMALLVATIVLHSYGWYDKALTKRAISVAEKFKPDLAEGFERSFDKLVKLISTEPVISSRRPPFPRNPTQFRKEDVVAFRIDGKWHPAYVSDITKDGVGSQFVKIEFYDLKLSEPVWKNEYKKAPAIGSIYKDGLWRRELYLVSGMTRNPDPAGQMVQIANSVKGGPVQGTLGDPVAGGAFTDLHRLPKIIRDLYKKDANKWKK